MGRIPRLRKRLFGLLLLEYFTAFGPEAAGSGDRIFVDILRAAQQYGLEGADSAWRKALSQGTRQGEGILNIIARQGEPEAPETITPTEKLLLREEPLADCGRYDRLRKGEVSHAAP